MVVNDSPVEHQEPRTGFSAEKESLHVGTSGKYLLGDNLADMGDELSPYLIADENTPRTFIWHTFNDNVVNVINSLEYAERLRHVNVSTELHIFPEGRHGLGLASDDPYVSMWSELLIRWLELDEFV